jgi:hypothetical protein
VEHVAHDGRLGETRLLKDGLRYFWEFLGAEFALLNPIFFIGILMAMIAVWRHTDRDSRKMYFFWMGAPLFLFYLAFTLHSRVFPNWIAPAILPLICLMVLFWHKYWNKIIVRRCFLTGVGIGITLTSLLHDTNLLGKLTGRHLPPKIDPLQRVRGWKATAEKVEEYRYALETRQKKPAFLIGNHYGIVGQMSFYNPKARLQVRIDPLVYYHWGNRTALVTNEQNLRTEVVLPENQFHFWPTYTNRVGQSAIYVQIVKDPGLVEGWIPKWWSGETNYHRTDFDFNQPPEALRKQFKSIHHVGIVEIPYRDNRIIRRVRLFECLDLQPPQ